MVGPGCSSVFPILGFFLRSTNPKRNEIFVHIKLLPSIAAVAIMAAAPAAAAAPLSSLILSEVASHTTKDDCWLVIHGKVYDVTHFLEEHPGGEEVLIEASGKDATQEFNDIGHSDEAKSMLKDFCIGVLEGFEVEPPDFDAGGGGEEKEKVEAKQESLGTGIQKKEPSVFLRYLLPLLVLGLAFALRFLKGNEA
eukprot:c20365_g1_i1 orf=788-1372(-)